MKEEFKSLTQNKTWTLCKLPQNRKAINSKWVYKIKTKSDSTIERFKARLVAQGFSQRYGVDYDETFSPVATMPTIRILISLQAYHWQVRQLDVDTAYLNAKLDADIFITQPKGFEAKTNQGEPQVCKLNKAIYGLKQAGLAWYNHMSSLLHDMNFEKTDSDQCLFIKRGSNPILIATYVDDLLVASPTIDGIIKFENDLQKKINIKVLGDVKHILGWNINYDDKLGVSNTQRSYITRILKQFGMQDCNPVKTPALKGQHVKTDTDEKEQEFPYREAVGSLFYVANSCRPASRKRLTMQPGSSTTRRKNMFKQSSESSDT